MLLRVINLSFAVFFLAVCFCGQSKSGSEGFNGGTKKIKVQAQQGQGLGSEETNDTNTVDNLLSQAQRKNEDSAAKGTGGSGLVNTPREAWIANIGGNIVIHLVAITFQDDSSFVYRDAYKEIEGEKWMKIAGTIGKWHINGNKITMTFSDGYAITYPYAIIDEELIFDIADDCDERLGCGIYTKYNKEKMCSTELK